ncbi:MAG: hypothetical protein AB8G18_09190 [Gammaproteobacteria bacterium]
MIDDSNRMMGDVSSGGKKLRGMFKRSSDDKLLDLFWNRADLKKQFSSSRDVNYDLKNQLKSAEKELKRRDHEMRALESRLADPVAGYNAMVFFQLRQLWDQAMAKLEVFSEELITQQKDRERKKQIMEFNQERQKRLQTLNEKIVVVKERSDNAKDSLQIVETRYAELTGVFNVLKRKSLQPVLEQSREEYEEVRELIEGLFDERIKIESEPWPDFPGLTVDGRRVINTAIIALAQHLCVHFSQHSLASLARTAVTQKLQKVDYGSKSDCEYLMENIRKAVVSMQEDRGFASELKARSKWLRSKASYRSDEDTRPIADTVGGIPVALPGADFGNTVAGMPIEINVLAEDYWHLSQVLID